MIRSRHFEHGGNGYCCCGRLGPWTQAATGQEGWHPQERRVVWRDEGIGYHAMYSSGLQETGWLEVGLNGHHEYTRSGSTTSIDLPGTCFSYLEHCSGPYFTLIFLPVPKITSFRSLPKAPCHISSLSAFSLSCHAILFLNYARPCQTRTFNQSQL